MTGSSLLVDDEVEGGGGGGCGLRPVCLVVERGGGCVDVVRVERVR